MHPTSRRTKVIGFIGLGWFLYFAGSGVTSLVWPEQLRAYSKEPWTDREIVIGATGYIVVGSAGLIVAVRRLVVPWFLSSPRIGHERVACLASVAAVPEYDLFRYFHVRTMQRSALWATFTRALWVAFLYFAVTRGPYVMGLPWPPSLPIHAMILGGLTGVVALTFGMRWALAAPLLRRRWDRYSQIRETRRFDFFDDGILEQGSTFRRTVPWVRIRGVEIVGDVLAIELAHDWIIISPSELAHPQAIERVIELLRQRVGKLKQRDAIPRAQPVRV